MSVAIQQASRERLTAVERLALLCDEGSLQAIRSQVRSRRMGARSRAGDGVVAATATVSGRPVVCYAQDSSYAGGSLGEAHADSIVRALRLAGRAGLPVIGFVESAGARMQEGVAALAGYGRIFYETVALSGRVPQISVVTGVSAGGGSYSPALTDFLVMAEDATMFLTGPGVVREALGEEVTAPALGGARVHERNGVCQFVASSEVEAVFLARDLLSYLPQSAAQPPPRRGGGTPAGPGSGLRVPDEPRRAYDVREVIRAIADEGALLEASARWARNMVTAFCRIDGRAVGVVANQPRHLGGVIDATAAEKGARHVRTCSAFGLPLVVLVDTPGFMPGTRQEAAGVIRHGASLVRAFAAATVPRLTVVLRKAYGGAYITMNSMQLGADLVLAWPGAEVGIMAAQQAVSILHRGELSREAHPERAREGLARAYSDEHLGAEVAARDGFVDEVITPDSTRARLTRGLELLAEGG
jgi:methylmalonyl-CoA decarboxylase subunit alpha